MRTEATSELFRPEAVEGRARLGVRLPAAPPVAWAAVSVGTAVLMGLVSLAFVPYTIEHRAEGRTAFDNHLRDVVVPQPSTVTEILVREGERVSKGQRLLSISPLAGNDSDAATAEQLMSELRMQETLLTRNVGLSEDDFRIESRRIQIEASAIDRQIALLPQQRQLVSSKLNTAKEELQRAEQLLASKFVSASDVARLRSAVIATEQEYAALEQRLIDYSRQRNGLDVALAQAKSAMERRRITGEVTLSDLRGKVVEAKGRQSTQVVAEATGTVAAVLAQPGQAVMDRQSVLSIVPEGSRLIGRVVVPADVAVHATAGQSVDVRFRSVSYSRFGESAARVTRVVPLPAVPGVVDPLAQIDLELVDAPALFAQAGIAPTQGMVFTVSLPREQMSVLELLTRPIFDRKNVNVRRLAEARSTQ